MNHQELYLQDIERLDLEMKALKVEIQKRASLGANPSEMEEQYVRRVVAKNALQDLVRKNLIDIEDMIKEHRV